MPDSEMIGERLHSVLELGIDVGVVPNDEGLLPLRDEGGGTRTFQLARAGNVDG